MISHPTHVSCWGIGASVGGTCIGSRDDSWMIETARDKVGGSQEIRCRPRTRTTNFFFFLLSPSNHQLGSHNVTCPSQFGCFWHAIPLTRVRKPFSFGLCCIEIPIWWTVWPAIYMIKRKRICQRYICMQILDTFAFLCVFALKFADKFV